MSETIKSILLTIKNFITMARKCLGILDKEGYKQVDCFEPAAHTHDFTDIKTTSGGTTTTLTDALAGKADKKVPSVSGNFAALDSNGNLVDSQENVSNFARAVHTHGQYAPSSSPAFTGTVSVEYDIKSSTGSLLIKNANNNASIKLDANGITEINSNSIAGTSVQNDMSSASTSEAKIPTSGAVKAALNDKEDKSNMVTTTTGWSQQLSDTKYPSEKLVKQSIGAKADATSPHFDGSGFVSGSIEFKDDGTTPAALIVPSYSDITDGSTNLQSVLAGKAASVHTHTKSQITDFAHTHTMNDVTGLSDALADKAASVHSHEYIADSIGASVKTTGGMIELIVGNENLILDETKLRKLSELLA